MKSRRNLSTESVERRTKQANNLHWRTCSASWWCQRDLSCRACCWHYHFDYDDDKGSQKESRQASPRRSRLLSIQQKQPRILKEKKTVKMTAFYAQIEVAFFLSWITWCLSDKSFCRSWQQQLLKVFRRTGLEKSETSAGVSSQAMQEYNWYSSTLGSLRLKRIKLRDAKKGVYLVWLKMLRMCFAHACQKEVRITLK